MTSSSSEPFAVKFRPARPEEADALSDLAVRSKAHWGYDAAFLEACRTELRIDPAWCDGIRLEVAEHDGRLLAFSRIGGEPPAGWLHDLFVDPVAIGQGVGRAMLQRAVATAAGLGLTTLEIESDPHAEAFYLRCGAVRIGETVSPIAAGRMLPLLILRLQAAPGGAG